MLHESIDRIAKSPKERRACYASGLTNELPKPSKSNFLEWHEDAAVANDADAVEEERSVDQDARGLLSETRRRSEDVTESFHVALLEVDSCVYSTNIRG